MKLTQSTIFHTKTSEKTEIEEYILQIISSTQNNPDYFELGVGEKQSIGIKQIKELISWVQTRPYQEDNKLAVIFEADKMTIESQNGLLKVLEEPPVKSYIFLLTQNPKRLLDTIRSRANIIHTRKTEIDRVYRDIESNYIFPQNLQGQLTEIKKILDVKESKEKKEAIRELLRNLHLDTIYSSKHKDMREQNLKLIQQTEKALNTNTNTKLVLENLFFNYKSL